MSIKLEPASPGEVAVYQPYFAVGKRQLLPLAMGLYRKGSFEGQRLIEGGDPVPFIATWILSPLPSDLTQCSVQFEQDAELAYDMTLDNYEFVEFLIDVVNRVQRGSPPDFNTSFYKKLMRRDE